MPTEIRTDIAPAVAVLQPVNSFILDRAFPTRRYFETQKVRFDLALTANTTATYTSFIDKATVVKKDGFNTVELYPIPINDAIVKTAEDAKLRGFGEPQLGGPADPQAEALQTELEGFGKLRARAKRTEVKAAYEALTTGQIELNVDGIDVVDFGIPAEQIETVAPAWTDANADPIADMIAAYDAMKVKPTTVVLGREAYNAFLSNPNVLTDKTDGKAKNVEKSTPAEVGKYGQDVIRVGMLVDRPLEIVVDMSMAEIDGTQAELMPAKYAVYVSENVGGVFYGGIPVAAGETVVGVAAEFVPQTSITDDPVQVKDIYRSAPLPAITNPYAVWSQKVVG